MPSCKVQVLGEGMLRRDRHRSFRNLCPVEANSGEVGLFDLAPELEPVNPTFQPVMIGGDNQKAYDESGKRKIAALVPAESVERDTAGECSYEEDQAPAGERGTGALTFTDQCSSPPKQSFELRLAG